MDRFSIKNYVRDHTAQLWVLYLWIGGHATLVWALVHYGQGSSFQSKACESRILENGIQGNPDFYGLGIRVGIYLQWFASLVAITLRLKNWTAMFGAWMTFSFALIVAVLMLTFQRGCTFTAEIIVILFIWWGGCVGLFYNSEEVTKSYTILSVLSPTGVRYTWAAIWQILIIYSTWFWLRMATAGDVDFASGVNGTHYLLVRRIDPTRSKGAAGFVTFLCFIFAFDVFFVAIAYQGHLHYVLGRLTYQRYLGHPWIPPKFIFAESHSMSDSLNSMEDEDKGLNFRKVLFTICCTCVLVYSIIAVELTLKWNNISGVYEISSTGQVIPFVIGIGLVINVAWEARLRDYFYSKENNADHDTESQSSAVAENSEDPPTQRGLRTRATW